MKQLILAIGILLPFTSLHAQSDTKPQLDSITVLRIFAMESCKCVDSITLAGKDSKEIAEDIKKCIDKEVAPYQLSVKIFKISGKPNKNNTLSINEDPESDEYKQYYYQLETWLRDSCASLKKAVASNNKETAHSFSSNPQAIDQYNMGVPLIDSGDYANSIPYFKKAVEIDPQFAFAWDNLGIAYRHTEQYDLALDAYKHSLAIDPTGHTPLQNIAIVYEYQKKYDEALKAYQNIINVYSDDPESYYGVGRIYTYFDVDLEKGLDNMCKAYNLYIKINSPYRVDAEKTIGYIYGEMKKAGKEDEFNKILKDNNISTTN